MSQYDLMKRFEQYDEISVGDFTPEELEEFLGRKEEPSDASRRKEKYFEYYDDVKDKSLKKQDW